jgi:hypothetical protein
MTTHVPVLIPAQSHALPYRVVLEEYRARRGDAEYIQLIGRWSDEWPSKPEDVRLNDPGSLGAVESCLDKVEHSYLVLQEAQLELRRISGKRYNDPQARLNAVDLANKRVLDSLEECQELEAPLKALLHLLEGSALCLSGGGIRSASFSLGILQGLARFSTAGKEPGLLQNLDFVSTVSGGGYIGSWLMGWAYRRSFDEAVKGLAEPGKTGGDPEPDPVRHLRSYTSFLAPRYGFTVDTTTLSAIVLRNLFLNWIIFLPCLIVLLICPRILAIAGAGLTNFLKQSRSLDGHNRLFLVLPEQSSRLHSFLGNALVYILNTVDLHTWDQTLALISCIFILLAGCIAALRVWQPPSIFGQKDTALHSENIFVIVTVLASWTFVNAWRAGWLYHDYFDYITFNWGRVTILIGFLFAALLPMTLVRILRALKYGGGAFMTNGRYNWTRIIGSILASAVVSAVTAVILEVFATQVGGLLYGGRTPEPRHRFQILALPIVLCLLMLGQALLSGLLSSLEEEEEREWWARAGGVLFIVILTWLVAEFACWLPFAHFLSFKGDILSWGIASAVSGGAAAAAGTSAASAAGTKRVDLAQLSRAGKFLARHELLAPSLACIALGCILLLVAHLNQFLLEFVQNYLDFHPGFRVLNHVDTAHLAVFYVGAVAIAIAVCANGFINVNAFSLHGMYRLRLVRAFLGASNFGRDADRFTNFDKSDNFPQKELQSLGNAPVHVVNTTLNLVSTRNKAWQQRKAESFTFTPFRAGSWRLAYAATESFGGEDGVSLGTAMAISGAAVNPNMGYNSSPLATLLMTLFNTRLGWWLPNPGWAHRRKLEGDKQQKFLAKSGPSFALASIVSEALGKTDDRRKWIQLSDGAHFENFGLYEMVLRRCRHIVVVDAGADRKFNFEDLGNAIRKIQIDLGIPITFPGVEAWPFQAGTQTENRYCVVGKIDYACVDTGAEPGCLVYIKPCLNGGEPRDVTAYATAHDSFPHETTANQFFNEAQFESYRHLGSYVIDKILQGAGVAQENDIQKLVTAGLEHSGQENFPQWRAMARTRNLEPVDA